MSFTHLPLRILLATPILAVPLAHASDITYSFSGASSSSSASLQWVSGASPNVDTLNIGSAGTLTLNLSTVNLPGTASDLLVAVNSAQSAYAAVGGVDSIVIKTPGPEKLFLDVFAKGSSANQYSIYSLDSNFTPEGSGGTPPPVPLAPSGWLMFGGLLAMAGMGLSRRQHIFVTHRMM